VDCLPSTQLYSTQETILLADEKILFNKEVKTCTVLEKVKYHYSLFEIGLLRDDVCVNLLNYLMQKKDKIIAYYFLTKDVIPTDLSRIKKLLKLQKYRNRDNRETLMMVTLEKMLTCIPAMIVRCFQAALTILITDSSTMRPVNNDLLVPGTFSVLDFVDLIILKAVVVNYVSENTGINQSDVLQQMGCIGEDVNSS